MYPKNQQEGKRKIINGIHFYSSIELKQKTFLRKLFGSQSSLLLILFEEQMVYAVNRDDVFSHFVLLISNEPWVLQLPKCR